MNPVYSHAIGAVIGAVVFVVLVEFVFPQDAAASLWWLGAILLVLMGVGVVALVHFARGSVLYIGSAAMVAFGIALLIEFSRGVL